MPALSYNLKAWRVKILLSLDCAEMRETWRSPNTREIGSCIKDFYCPMSWPLLDSYLYFILNHIYNISDKPRKVKKNFRLFYCTIRLPAARPPNYMTIKDLEVRLIVPTKVDILALALEVEESDPVLQVADLVADRNLIGGTENAVLQGFVEDGDFFKHFWFCHKYNLNEFWANCKKKMIYFKPTPCGVWACGCIWTCPYEGEPWWKGLATEVLGFWIFCFSYLKLTQVLAKVKFFFRYLQGAKSCRSTALSWEFSLSYLQGNRVWAKSQIIFSLFLTFFPLQEERWRGGFFLFLLI